MADTPKPMTADELLKHPEYEHTIWDLKPTQKAKVPVAKDRGGPINIAYEVHGHGDIHVVVRYHLHTLCTHENEQRTPSNFHVHKYLSICHALKVRPRCFRSVPFPPLPRQ